MAHEHDDLNRVLGGRRKYRYDDLRVLSKYCGFELRPRVQLASGWRWPAALPRCVPDGSFHPNALQTDSGGRDLYYYIG